LRELYLPNNRMDPKCLIYMAEGLKHNQSLEVLDMSKNPIGGPSIEGVIALRDALSHNNTLRGLFLSDTQLGTEGAIAIAEYLPETKSLVHLDLTSNSEIDIAGIMALAVSIKMNHSIRILDVNVRPNDAEAAQFSRDILQACVRNTELSHKEDRESSNGSSLPDNHQPTEIPHHLDDIKKEMSLAEESLKVFGAMLSNEEPNIDKVENNEIIEQLRSQCQDLQSKIRVHIASIADEKLLEDLLALNDNISLALQKHANIYINQLSPSSSEPESTQFEQNDLSSTTEPVTASDGTNDLTLLEPEQKLPITNPQQPEPFSEFLPTFSIGDSDEEIESVSDTLYSEGKNVVSQLQLPDDVFESQDRRSSMEEMNKLLVLEEGEVLKKSKSIRDEQDNAK
ncbi:12133_t:CDS:2, partial [Acaulospora morrowiae]